MIKDQEFKITRCYCGQLITKIRMTYGYKTVNWPPKEQIVLINNKGIALDAFTTHQCMETK